jgi:NADPH-dependent glutamate synthase beta subunit-like oxidoreductase
MTNSLAGLASEAKHLVVICGGGVAGSEAAAVCASKGIVAVVIEQNPCPYGKIEDGLPRWHGKYRQKECERIAVNLATPGVVFVPNTRIGRDIAFDELLKEWQPSALLLANGAWRDRPLPVGGIDRFIGRGLVYQNPFVHWFNHYPESGYSGPHYDLVDDIIVVGGGLASIDVAKIINLELYSRALRSRGIDIPVVEMHRLGIAVVLDKHRLTPEELGVKGCTLFYRRRKRDMPLSFPPANPTPEQLEKTASVRERVMDSCIKKFLVRFRERNLPIGALVEEDRLIGLRFRRTDIRDGRVIELPGTEHEVRSQLIVSSIGSVPEPVEGIPTHGEFYNFSNGDTGELTDLPGVFGLGNVLAGKGNVQESRANARGVTERVITHYLGVGDDDGVAPRAPLSPKHLARVFDRVQARWKQVGYDGDCQAWIQRMTPPDLATVNP